MAGRLKKIIGGIRSAGMSDRLLSMLPQSEVIAKTIAEGTTEKAMAHVKDLARGIGSSALKGVAPGAALGAAYGLVSDEEGVFGGAVKGALVGGAAVGGYSAWRARGMLDAAASRGWRSLGDTPLAKQVTKSMDKIGKKHNVSLSPQNASAERGQEFARRQKERLATKEADLKNGFVNPDGA